jgi:dipeptidyl aminopeptidase/acylaminoacyl peptidase
VPLDHAELLRNQLDDAGMSYEWMVRDEGHGFSQPENRIDMYEAMLAFLNKHIGEDRIATR